MSLETNRRALNLKMVVINQIMPLGKIFWHESMHWLKSNNPKLYRHLIKATGITDAQRDAYLERTGRTDLITDEAIDEEILADQFEDVAKRTGLLQNIAGKNRGLIERVIQWLKDTMNKFVDHFRNPQGKLTTEQATRLADEFGKIANQLKDANGQKIFRYNRLTHNIELADGRDLDSVKSNDDIRYSFAGKKAKTANQESLKRAKKMDERGADRDKIYEATGWFKGRDNKWRFEIPDNFDQMDFDKLWWNEDTQYQLDEIYDNPALFDAYPTLRGILISASTSLPASVHGETTSKEITLNWNDIDDDRREAAKTLVHEIQHVIQEREKFASGSAPERISLDSDDNANRIVYATDKIKAPYSKKYFDSILAVKKAIKRGNQQAESKARKEMQAARQELSTSEREKIEHLAERYYEIKSTRTSTKSARIAAYERAGGEQEARHVEERLFNREGKPVAHDPDALIIFGGKTYPMSRQSFANKKNASENGDGELVYESRVPSAATANGTTKNAVKNITAETNNKGGVSSNADVETNSPSESISQGRQDSNIKYSIGNSNSNESLSQKISNKLSSWFSTPPQRRKKQITENLRRLSGHRILYGYVEDADDVVVDQMQKLIQSRNAYDWEKLLPVVGKEISKNLKLNPTSEQSNYIADWLLTGALNNNSAEAKTFQKAMRENPAMAELLQETRDLFQEITDMSSWERVSESLKKQESKTFLQKRRQCQAD